MSELSRAAYRIAKADPGWQAAHDDCLVEKLPDESAHELLLRRLIAIRRMHEIESRAEVELQAADETER